MFVRDFVHVEEPFELAAPRFVADPSWLVPIAEEACERACRLTATPAGGPTGAPTASPGGGRLVHCEIGPVRARSNSILVPVWFIGSSEPQQPCGMPDLNGDLEVGPLGTDGTLLALGATYRRPSREPETLARVERATEAVVRTFLHGVAEELSHVGGRET